MEIKRATDESYAYADVTDEEYKAIKKEALKGLSAMVLQTNGKIKHDDKNTTIRRS